MSSTCRRGADRSPTAAHECGSNARTGRLQIDRTRLRLLVEPAQRPFVLFRCQHVGGDELEAAANWPEYEEVQGLGAFGVRLVEQCRQLAAVVPGNRGVDLDRDAFVA